jgi:hypothetical protein
MALCPAKSRLQQITLCRAIISLGFTERPHHSGTPKKSEVWLHGQHLVQRPLCSLRSWSYEDLMTLRKVKLAAYQANCNADAKVEWGRLGCEATCHGMSCNACMRVLLYMSTASTIT